jgi:hypothetical protein
MIANTGNPVNLQDGDWESMATGEMVAGDEGQLSAVAASLVGLRGRGTIWNSGAASGIDFGLNAAI